MLADPDPAARPSPAEARAVLSDHGVPPTLRGCLDAAMARGWQLNLQGGSPRPGRWECRVTREDDDPAGHKPGLRCVVARHFHGGPSPNLAAAAGVVLAADGPGAVDLLTGPLPQLAAQRPVQVPGVALVTLIVDVPELDASPRGTGVLVARGVEGIAAKALTHATAKWGWLREQAGPGSHILRVSYGRAGDTPADLGAATRDQELFAQAVADASALLGVRIEAADVVDWDVVRWAGALPHAAVGHKERVSGLRAAVAPLDGLEVTGGWLAGTGLVSVIDDAAARAEALADGLGLPARPGL